MEDDARPIIVVSHASALRGIRSARRRYGQLPWRELTVREQDALRRERYARRAEDIDFGFLIREGFTDGDSTVDLLFPTQEQRARNPRITAHTCAMRLPRGALLEVSKDVYCASPAFAVLQQAAHIPFPTLIAQIMELCGGFSLSEFCEAVPERSYAHAEETDMGTPSYHESDPVLTCAQLGRFTDALSRVPGRVPARNALRIALDGARSPTEAIMAAFFHAPHRYGGFNIRRMLLNQRVDFDHRAHTVSGLPYAICDALIPDAHGTLEYNGGDHDTHGARVHDERRAMGLKAMGIATYPINDVQLRDIEAMEVIAEMLHKAAGGRYQNRTRGYRVRQVELLNGLRRAFGLRPC